MAVYSTVVTAPTSAATTTLTSWAPYVLVTVPSAAANAIYVSTSGTAATNGTDSVLCGPGTSTYVRNRAPRPDLTTTTPSANDYSAVPAFKTSQTAVSLVASAAVTNVQLTLASSAGGQPVLG